MLSRITPIDMAMEAVSSMSPRDQLLMAHRIARNVPPEYHSELRRLGHKLARHADHLERVNPASAGSRDAPVGADHDLPDQLPAQAVSPLRRFARAPSRIASRTQRSIVSLKPWVGDVLGVLCLFGFGYILFFFAGVLSP